jgi:WD40 repeat protein
VLPVGDIVVDLALSPDGKLLAVATGRGKAELWDRVKMTRRATFNYAPGAIRKVSFNVNGSQVYTVGGDQWLMAWEFTGNGTPVRRFPGQRPLGYAFSPKGQLLAVIAADSIELRELPSGTSRATRSLSYVDRGNPYSTTFSPDLRHFAATPGDNTVRVFVLPSLMLERRLAVTGPIYDVEFSPDGSSLAVAAGTGVKLIDAVTGALRKELSHGVSARALAFSPGGEMLVSGESDGSVRLFDVQSGSQVHQTGRSGNAIFALRFSADGAYVAGIEKGGREVLLYSLVHHHD